jgi:hypothetical protein
MLYGINVVLFTLTSVFVALYLLRRRNRIVTTQLSLQSDCDE